MTLSVEELNNMLLNNPGLRKRNPGLAKKIGAVEPQSKEASKSPKYYNQKVYVYEDSFVAVGQKATGHGLEVEHYDSLKEYKRYQELLLMQRAGHISQLQRQVKFVIQEAFSYRGEKVHEISYVADHCYLRGKDKIVEDVKGVGKDGKTVTATKDFHLKWKLLKHKYPDLIFEIY